MGVAMRRLALTGVRLSRHLTQEQVAEAMATTQSAVSRMERQEDVLLSTLDAYVAAAGGVLLVAAVYPDGEVVQVTVPDHG